MDNRTIKLVSKDGKTFEVSEQACKRSGFIKGLLDDYPDNDTVQVKEVNATILEKVKVFLDKYEKEEPQEIKRPIENFKDSAGEWNANFIEVDRDTIFEIIMAANYMDIKPLLELAAAKVASKIKGKTTEQIITTLNLQNEFTPEEEMKIIEENAWCLDNL